MSDLPQDGQKRVLPFSANQQTDGDKYAVDEHVAGILAQYAIELCAAAYRHHAAVGEDVQSQVYEGKDESPNVAKGNIGQSQ